MYRVYLDETAKIIENVRQHTVSDRHLGHINKNNQLMIQAPLNYIQFSLR